MTTSLKVLSYNIHKGFSTGNLRFVLPKIKESIHLIEADLVFLQEVVGNHEGHTERMISHWPTTAQFEFLADSIWEHYAYGKNAIYSSGHHGNAILSKHPFSFWENIDISTNSHERRGLLHGIIEAPNHGPTHVICVHLDLFENGRQSQLRRLKNRVDSIVPKEAPLLIAGDFNDWAQRAAGIMENELNLKEAFLEKTGVHARTFPVWMPILRLDRIYFRGFKLETAHSLTGEPWRNLSDHVALYAELT